jgi:hypothetical protein
MTWKFRTINGAFYLLVIGANGYVPLANSTVKMQTAESQV